MLTVKLSVIPTHTLSPVTGSPVHGGGDGFAAPTTSLGDLSDFDISSDDDSDGDDDL